MAVGNFVVEEILPFMASARLSLILVSDISFLLLGLATLRKRSDKIMIFIFLFLGVVSSIYNRVPTLLWINGLRDYIPFLFALPIIRYFYNCDHAEEYRKSFDRQLKIFLILQTVCVTEQFFRYGAGDHGGGSLGDLSSGLISISIILISFYFVTKDWDGENYLQSLKKNRLYFFLMFPVLLNETKVSFVLIFVYLILLYPFNLRSVGKSIVALPLMFILVAAMYGVYMFATDGQNDFASSEYLENYLSGGEDAEDIMELAENAVDFLVEYSDEMDYVDLPRFMKVGLIVPALDDSRGGLVLGAGLGHLKGGSNFDQTDFKKDHLPLLFGTVMTVLFIVIPLGLVGLIWLIFWYKDVLKFSRRPYPMAIKVKLFLLVIAVLTFFYNDYVRYLVPVCIFYYIALAATYPEVGAGSKTEEKWTERRCYR